MRPTTVELLGSLPAQRVRSTSTHVVPVIGRWARPHELTIQPREVDAAFEVALAGLREPGAWRCVITPHRGPTWAWQLEDDLVWGVTARILTTLMDALGPGWAGSSAVTDLPILRPPTATQS